MGKTKEKKQRKWWQKILQGILFIVLFGLLLFAGVLLVLTLTEYKPKATEKVSIHGQATKEIAPGDAITVMTWNIGYGALGDNADFFMDGGTKVKTATKNRVNSNMAGIVSEIKKVNPDVAFFQEADQNSDRSYRIDETKIITQKTTGYENTYATNYRVLFIPYPVPPIGKVSAGILTLSSYPQMTASRKQLPCPFSWPERLGNLKRCLMVNRVKVKGTDKELVFVNLHLEAYDSGAGKKAQTKMLRELLETEAEKGNYVIAGGDFNQTFSNVDKSAYPECKGTWHAGLLDASVFDDSLSLIMDNTVPSCRSLDKAYAGADKDSFQYYLIDGFIVSSNVTVQSVKNQDLSFKNSDHNPVVLKATLAK